MKRTARFISVLLAVFMLFGAAEVLQPVITLTAYADLPIFAEGGFTYDIHGKTAVVTGYIGSDSDIVIPSKLGGKTVTEIGTSAFSNFQGLTSATIPKSVKTIGDYSFFDCPGLKSVTMKKGVRTIGTSAFEGCTSLTSVVIPKSVRSIEQMAFFGCKSLSDVTISKSVKSFGSRAFEGTPWLAAQQKKNPLVVVNGILIDGMTASGKVTIPDGVTAIGDSAFELSWNITGVKLPKSVKTIGFQAFCGCKKLKSVKLTKSVTSIGESAFSDCGKVKVTYKNKTYDYDHIDDLYKAING